MSVQSVAVYCGENPEMDPGQKFAAEALGISLAKSGIKVVYGGYRKGYMGVVADAALAAGGEVVGVALKKFSHNAHTGLTELHLVDTLSERKDQMRSLSDASVTLPGMDGTLDEYYGDRTEKKAAQKAVLEARRTDRSPSAYDLKLSQRPVVIFDPNGYYLPQREQAKQAGRVKRTNKDLERFVVGETTAEVFKALGMPDAPILAASELMKSPVLNGKGFWGALRTKRHYSDFHKGVGSDNIREHFQAAQLQVASMSLPVYAVMAAAYQSTLSQGGIAAHQIPGNLGVVGGVLLLNFLFCAEALTGRHLFSSKNDPGQPKPYARLLADFIDEGAGSTKGKRSACSDQRMKLLVVQLAGLAW